MMPLYYNKKSCVRVQVEKNFLIIHLLGAFWCKKQTLPFFFVHLVHRARAAVPNKKYGDVCLLQQEGSNQLNLLFEMKTQEEHITASANIFKQNTLKRLTPLWKRNDCVSSWETQISFSFFS